MSRPIDPGPCLVRAKWLRPPWCREDWLLVRIFGGPHYYSPVDRVELDAESGVCWVRAYLTGVTVGPRWRWYRVKYADFEGEGSLNTIYEPSYVREVS